MKKLYTLSVMLVLMGALLSVTGCNTMRGIGQDVEAVGESVEDAAD